MYLLFEYLAYIVMVSVLGAILFAASATLLITKEAARRLTKSSSQVAAPAAEQLTNKTEANLACLSQDHQPIP